jgi:hypothetical protein
MADNLEKKLADIIINLICDCTATRDSRLWFENYAIIDEMMGKRISQESENIAKRMKNIIKELGDDYMRADDSLG